MPNDLMSIGTAANVLGNYTLELTDEVLATVYGGQFEQEVADR